MWCGINWGNVKPRTLLQNLCTVAILPTTTVIAILRGEWHHIRWIQWAEERAEPQHWATALMCLTNAQPPSNMVTFGKVTAFQQLRKDNPEWINDCCTFVIWVLCVLFVSAPQSSTCGSSAWVPKQAEHSGLSIFPWKLHKTCGVTSRLPLS